MPNESNQHCQARVYLGEDENQEQSIMAYDSHEKFSMRINVFEDFEHNTEPPAVGWC